VDYRLVEAPYIGRSFQIGDVGIAFRLLVPFVVGVLMRSGRSRCSCRIRSTGRAAMGVAQDALALRLMGVDRADQDRRVRSRPSRPPALSGALAHHDLPVEPSIGRAYIRRVFAITVLGGLGKHQRHA